MKTVVILATISLFCLSNAVSQTRMTSGPEGRNKPGFVYDSARKKFVLFGGFGRRGEGIKGDTWEWDGTTWARVDTTGPSPRGAMGMAYDSKRRRVVMFGGADTNGQLADTWEGTAKHGNRWRRLVPQPAVARRWFTTAEGKK